MVLNAAQNACLDCAKARADYQAAASMEDVDRAKAIVSASVNCTSWVSEARANINKFLRDRECKELEAQMYAMANRVPQADMGIVDGLFRRAQSLGCNVSSQTRQALTDASGRHNKEADRRFQQDQQRWREEDERQQRNQQALMNIWGQTMEQVQRIQDDYNRPSPPIRQPDPYRPPPSRTPPSRTPSRTSSSSSSTGQKPQTSSASKVTFVAFLSVPTGPFASTFRITTESRFKELRGETSEQITILGRGKTQKEAEQKACGKLIKGKPRLGLKYRYGKHLVRGVGSRCN